MCECCCHKYLLCVCLLTCHEHTIYVTFIAKYGQLLNGVQSFIYTMLSFAHWLCSDV